MKLGLHIAATDWEGGPKLLGPKLAEVVQATEAAGFDAISVVDHVWQSPYLDGPEKNEIASVTVRPSTSLTFFPRYRTARTSRVNRAPSQASQVT